MLTRKLLTCLLLVTLLVTACDPIGGDAGRVEPTPPPNRDSEIAAHEWRIEQKEAMR